MLINLLDKLIDRYIQLASRSKKMSRRSFDDFVEPVHLQFEMVHSEYLESFRQYRSAIQDANAIGTTTLALLDQIQANIIFTTNQREKIKKFLVISSSPLAGDFVSSIKHYLNRNLYEILVTKKLLILA